MNTAETLKQSLHSFKKFANDFEIIRNNKSIGSVKAIVSNNNFSSTIQTFDDTKILDGDYLSIFDKKYYIIDAKPQIYDNELCYYILKYTTDIEYNKPKQNTNIHTYNINAPISGTTFIGEQHDFTLNIDNSIKNIQKIINNKTEDKEALQELLYEIKETFENNKPLTKGIFSKFSDLLAKHSDIAIAVGNFLTTLFFSE